MTTDRDMDRLLGRWLEAGPDAAPDRMLNVLADRIDRQPQRAAWRLDRRLLLMNPYVKIGAAIAAVIVIGIVGFGLFWGGDNSIVGPPAAGPTPNPTVAPSSAPPAPTPVTPSATPVVGVPGACDLVTPDEAGNALHLSSAVSSVSLIDLDINNVAPFPSWLCEFHRGASLFVLRYEKENGANAFAIWKNQTGFEAVSGLGDDAAWNPALTTLYILKGDRLVTILPLEGPDPKLTLEAARAIGAIAATRM